MPTPPTFVTGQVLTAAQMNRVGLWEMVPTSVAGTGVTLSGSQVVFSASTAISVNGCFTSDFRRYRVELNFVNTVGQVFYWRLRAAGSDAVTNNYGYITAYRSYAAGAQGNFFGAALSTSPLGYGAANTSAQLSFDIDAPYLADRTTLSGTAAWQDAAAWVGSQHSLATSYDGMTFFIASGGVTYGTINIYGYNQ
jgi:hypothetical protein